MKFTKSLLALLVLVVTLATTCNAGELVDTKELNAKFSAMETKMAEMKKSIGTTNLTDVVKLDVVGSTGRPAGEAHNYISGAELISETIDLSQIPEDIKTNRLKYWAEIFPNMPSNSNSIIIPEDVAPRNKLNKMAYEYAVKVNEASGLDLQDGDKHEAARKAVYSWVSLLIDIDADKGAEIGTNSGASVINTYKAWRAEYATFALINMQYLDHGRVETRNWADGLQGEANLIANAAADKARAEALKRQNAMIYYPQTNWYLIKTGKLYVSYRGKSASQIELQLTPRGQNNELVDSSYYKFNDISTDYYMVNDQLRSFGFFQTKRNLGFGSQNAFFKWIMVSAKYDDQNRIIEAEVDLELVQILPADVTIANGDYSFATVSTLYGKIAQVKIDMIQLDKDITAKMATLRADLLAQQAALKKALEAKLAELKKDVVANKDKIAKVQSEVNVLQSQMSRAIDDIDDLEDDVKDLNKRVDQCATMAYVDSAINSLELVKAKSGSLFKSAYALKRRGADTIISMATN